ncbi:MAG: DUF6599 family protein [Candidatus Acidiferrum sp.]
MRRIIYAVVLLGSLAWVGAAAEPALLPDRIGPWLADGPAKNYSLKELPADWIGFSLDGHILHEAGLVRVENRTYKNGDQSWSVRLWVLGDPSGAYELHTALVDPRVSKPGTVEDTIASGAGLFLIGNLVMQGMSSSMEIPLEDLRTLRNALAARADKTPYPPLKSYLPVTWRVFGTERYALGPVGFRAAMDSLGQGAYSDLADHVGFQLGVEAILAKYQGAHGSGVLLLLEYPTPQIAEQHLHHLEEALPAAAKQSGVTVERKASLLSLVFEPTSAMHAQAIRDEVNYETQVTWNEPSHTATDPPLVVMMVKIFLFTGLFLGFATGVGIAFGGVRVVIKRLFPGKVFDRPESIEVLQLGLSGKKIDASDMY